MESPDALFDEHAADAEVIKNLLKELKLRGDPLMSKLIKTVDGHYYIIHSFEEVSPDAVAGMIAEKQQELKELVLIAPNGGQDNGQVSANGNSQPGTDNAAAPSGDGNTSVTPAADPNAQAQGEAPAAPAAPSDNQGQVVPSQEAPILQ